MTHLPVCSKCSLYRTCTYSYVFETPPPIGAKKLRLYPAAPHPFVFQVPLKGMHRLASEELCLPFTLFGRGVNALAHFITALASAGDRGVGRCRTRYRLRRIELETASGGWRLLAKVGDGIGEVRAAVPGLPLAPRQVRVELQTPLSVRRQGRSVGAKALGFADVFSSLLRRISLLSNFHGAEPLETEFRGLTQAARGIEFEAASLGDWKMQRFSTRQGAHVPMGGVTGHFTIDMGKAEPLWPYLWLGQWTHAGRAATMGLGRYRITDVASLQSLPGTPAPANMYP